MDAAPPGIETVTVNAARPAQSHFWAGNGFSFHDLLDTINPLQHLPVVSTIYRAITGDRPGLQFLDFVSTQGFRVLFPGVAVENGGGIASIALGGGGQVLSASSAVFNAVVTVAGLAGAMGLLARREFSYSDGGGGA